MEKLSRGQRPRRREIPNEQGIPLRLNVFAVSVSIPGETIPSGKLIAGLLFFGIHNKEIDQEPCGDKNEFDPDGHGGKRVLYPCKFSTPAQEFDKNEAGAGH